MANLENISADYLRDILAKVDDGDATQRLMAAITFKEIFGEKICTVLDNASYFTANAVQEFVEDTPIELCYVDSRRKPRPSGRG